MSVKLDRAAKLANKLPHAESEIFRSISDELFAELTSKQLALVMDALDKHWHKAVALANRQILEESCIWDGQQLREIARKLPEDVIKSEYKIRVGKLGGAPRKEDPETEQQRRVNRERVAKHRAGHKTATL